MLNASDGFVHITQGGVYEHSTAGNSSRGDGWSSTVSAGYSYTCIQLYL